MTYFADGSEYSFLNTGEAGPIINIGWLDPAHPLPTGHVPGDVIRTLARLCRDPVHGTRGFHTCKFCPPAGADREPFTTGRDEDGEFMVGSAEIRVAGPSGVTFAAPDMVIHYVTEHGYQPPDEFLAALGSSAG